MSLVYSPQLGRYVLGPRAHIGYQREAVRSRVISPLVANGTIEDYSFPTDAEVNVGKPCSLKIHNRGNKGIIAAGIVNVSGNPGQLTTKRDSVETTLSPGEYVRAASASKVDYCTKILPMWTIKFHSKGTYTILLWGMHEESGTWYYDDEIPLTVNVTEVSPPEWPHRTQTHIFDNLLMKCLPYKVLYQESRSYTVYDMEKVLGGKLRYKITWTAGGSIPPPDAYIYVNENEYVSTSLIRDTPITGEIDLISVEETLRVKIQALHTILFSDEIIFDVWVDIGYSETPSQPPKPTFDWQAWLEENGIWIAVGGVALAGIYLFTRKGPPVIIVPAGGK